MTQAVPAGAQAQPPQDSLQTLYIDIDTLIKRLANTPPQDVASMNNVLRGDVLELLKDTVREVGQLRSWAYQSVQDLDGRVEGVEAGDVVPETQFMPEDAEKFKALCLGVSHLIGIITAMGTQPSEVLDQLKQLDVIAKECAQIVEEGTLEEEEDDDEEDEAPEGAAGP